MLDPAPETPGQPAVPAGFFPIAWLLGPAPYLWAYGHDLLGKSWLGWTGLDERWWLAVFLGHLIGAGLAILLAFSPGPHRTGAAFGLFLAYWSLLGIALVWLFPVSGLLGLGPSFVTAVCSVGMQGAAACAALMPVAWAVPRIAASVRNTGC